MEISKKVLVIAIISSLLAGSLIGVVLKDNYNYNHPIQPGDVNYRFETLELKDECPYMEKSRQILLDELQSGLPMTGFLPFKESDYQWVKVTVTLKFNDSNVHFCHNADHPPTFLVHYEDGVQNARFKPTELRPAHIVNDPECKSDYDGIAELWYLLPPVTNSQTAIIPWKDVTLEHLRIAITSSGRLVPMN